MKGFLSNLEAKKISKKEQELCDSSINVEDLYKAMKSMPNNKSPGNDGLTKEFYELFWDDIKDFLYNSFITARHKKS